MSAPSTSDKKYLLETLALARRGAGWVNPNPMTGALVVKRGRVAGRGWHYRFGALHSEPLALRAAGAQARGATLYCNLEPHCFWGRTPPCTEVIIKAGIKRVVCITPDPNPKVQGRGFRQLRAAGIAVKLVPALQRQAEALNEQFFTFHRRRRPFVALKWAMSLDGKIATRTGDSKWITGEVARAYARELRGKYQAILVGINTILRDNPNLGARNKRWRDPTRIILDSALQIPPQSQVLRDANVIIATTPKAPQAKIKRLERRGITILKLKGRQVPIRPLLRELWKQSIASVLVEGGGEVMGSFVDAKLVDKVYAFQAPIIIGGAKATAAVAGEGVANVKKAFCLKAISLRQFGSEQLITGKI